MDAPLFSRRAVSGPAAQVKQTVATGARRRALLSAGVQVSPGGKACDPAAGRTRLPLVRDQLRDLDGVEGRALAQVVVADEQGQATAVVHTRVLPDAADVAGVATGCLQWGRDV